MTVRQLRVALLGPQEVASPTGPVDVRGVRLRGLLARLALDAGRYVSGDELAAALWGDELPVDQANALQSLVSRLRRALPDADLLESRPGGYRLVVPADDVDAVRFERAAREGGRLLAAGEPLAAAELLRTALDGWRGPALADVLDLPFAAAPAARLEELRLSATEDRIAADLAVARAAARVPDVVAELDGLTAAHPLRERLWLLRVSALRDAGRVPEALATYEQARGTLADQLGVDPGPELRELHLALLRGEPVPPTRTAEPRPRVATPLTSFVGRTAELDRVAALLATHRLVTLVGPGGAGKTRLALHAAQRAADRFGANVWTVELAPVNDPDDIDAALLGALTLRETNILDRLREAAGRDPLDRVCEALADRSALLVLDNCEHLVDAAARVAEQLLTRCPDLHVLATSREPLAVYGEALCPVPPLALPAVGATAGEALAHPAVRLFADRAAAVVPGFTVDDSTVAAVVQVCRRLDGLPLAIELAAARLRSLPLVEVERRLDDRFRLLTGGSRTAVPRHRTLRAVVEWSWDLLEDDERRLAERFCVLTAGGTPDSVQAVCTDDHDGDALDLLAALVDKSLLQVSDGVDPRYRMLETLREYGAERLTARGEIHDARVAHARYFRDLAETADPHLRTSDQLEWVARLTDERDNLLAALRFAADDGDADTALRIGAAMGWYWFMQGSHLEAATWLRIAIDVPGEGPPAETAACLSMYTVTAWALGLIDVAQSAQLRARVEAQADRARGLEWRYPALAILRPVLRMIADDSEGAVAAIDAADPVDDWTAATLLLMRAMLMENSGDAAGMLDNAGAALEGFRKVGDRWGMATTTAALALGRISAGDLDGSLAMFEESRRWLHELDATTDEAETLLRMASVHARAGRLDYAEALVDDAEDLVSQLGSQPFVLMCRCARGELARLRGDRDRARALLSESVARMGDLPAGPPHLHVIMLVGLAHVELDEGDVASARQVAEEAARLGRTTRDMPIVANVGVVVARLAAAEGDDEGAARLLGATRVLRGTDDPTLDDLVVLTAALRARLGDQAFAAAYESGTALTRDAALDLVDPR